MDNINKDMARMVAEMREVGELPAPSKGGSRNNLLRYNEMRERILEKFLSAFDAGYTLTPPNEPLTLDSRLTPKMVTCPKGWKGVRYTRFHCPGCKKVVKKGEAYCHKCGQALVFPIQRYDKENNRIWLDLSDRRQPEGEADGK